ncbi:sensor histidine kinase [Herbinix luporum]|uniref:sensor histidine kinase n=1 Tax=Herbinix luporum TaxID=1679721 RepID=UPI0023EF7FC3|nr:HAMP domain-containing sensor histidine kinase [Herbinix luporum]
MKKTLWLRLILCYLISVVMVFILVNTYGMTLLKNKLKKDQINLLYKEASLIANAYRGNIFVENNLDDDLASQFKSIDTYLNIRVWIVNREGRIIADSSNVNNPLDVNLNDLDPQFLIKTLSENTMFKNIFREPMLSVIYRVDYNFRLRGYIVLHSPMSEIQDRANMYLDVINICFLIFFPLLFLIFIYIYYITARPLKKLMKAAMEYSSGNYTYKLNIKGPNEYRDLGAAISYMAEEISMLDDYQKKFVANISHDFRSPLTSIKGYAEAILDGTIPTDMQDRYLNIILFETERLNKLTSSLLELNRFESRSALLDIVSFDINLVIKKTAESFEGACRSKKITLNLVFSSTETYVDADMSKIQQVLYNLIDNAIKFSHNNSKIKVSTEEKGEKVFVSVKDYGIGIPKDSIKKIWDRFYKTDASRGKDKKGTGLGLSITKEIIQAHNENINVVSTEGVGTEFIFSLPKTAGY